MVVRSFFIWFVLLLAAPALAQDEEGKFKDLYRNTVPTIRCQALSHQMKRDPDLVILDIRSKKEFEVSRIRSARLVEYDGFTLNDVADIDKNASIVVHCSVGVRSENVGEKLLKAGYKNVKNLYGGIFEWVNLGYPVYDKDGKETTKVHAFSKKWGVWLKNGEKVY